MADVSSIGAAGVGNYAFEYTRQVKAAKLAQDARSEQGEMALKLIESAAVLADSRTLDVKA